MHFLECMSGSFERGAECRHTYFTRSKLHQNIQCDKTVMWFYCAAFQVVDYLEENGGEGYYCKPLMFFWLSPLSRRSLSTIPPHHTFNCSFVSFLRQVSTKKTIAAHTQKPIAQYLKSRNRNGEYWLCCWSIWMRESFMHCLWHQVCVFSR